MGIDCNRRADSLGLEWGQPGIGVGTAWDRSGDWSGDSLGSEWRLEWGQPGIGVEIGVGTAWDWSGDSL